MGRGWLSLHLIQGHCDSYCSFLIRAPQAWRNLHQARDRPWKLCYYRSIRWICVRVSARSLFMYDPRERLQTGKPERACAGGRDQADGSVGRWHPLWGDWGECGGAAWTCLWHSVNRMRRGRAATERPPPPPPPSPSSSSVLDEHQWSRDNAKKTHWEREIVTEDILENIHLIGMHELCAYRIHVRKKVFKRDMFCKSAYSFHCGLLLPILTSLLFILLFHWVSEGSSTVPLPLAWTHWQLGGKKQEAFLPHCVGLDVVWL